MSCESEAAALLRAGGRRVTSARLAVIGALRHSGAHMTTAQVIGAARRQVSHINDSTVYRTLSEMSEAGLVAETSVGHGESFYQWIGDRRHHHLRCEACGGLTGLDERLVDRLASGTRSRHSFELNASHMVLTGVCARCRDKST